MSDYCSMTGRATMDVHLMISQRTVPLDKSYLSKLVLQTARRRVLRDVYGRLLEQARHDDFR